MTRDPGPVFTIAITTYNRLDLLKYSVRSILEQSFVDFEILIGNDFVSEVLTYNKIGFNDPRIIIINNDKNLGELGNMNNLLSRAKGYYFTWQFDDDVCSPEYLSEAYAALSKFGSLSCLYTALAPIYGRSDFKFPRNHIHHPHLYTGPGFLRAFLSGKHQVMGTAGIYKTDFLRETGGAIRLSSGNMAVYSEYLLIFNACKHSDIAYIDSRLVGFRMHESSWSGTTAEALIYKEAGINLLRAGLPVFSDIRFLDDYQKNLTSLLKSVISMVITKNCLAGIPNSDSEMEEFYRKILPEFNVLDPELRKISHECLSSTKKYIPLFRLKGYVRKIISVKYLRYAHMLSSIISPYLNKSF